ncbi:hypothetical protein GXP70_21330 [Paenibacillus lycopersici]|uniref:Aminoglycoside phosphotransferase domain-containing protein n=1 Tax=Paenibacillus lycopersici TaxID=2704462 RepID=A0A6C0G5E4_9BACL|nr:hypothetical protein [Paenibacillus lycopersici]QHT62270.1 hypothetical protein GXP70_21330 [Paenibacillus lycopersici]
MANLQPLFQEPIIRQIALSPGYEDHASDVWLVQTSREEVVVRASRMAGVPDQDFWYGCNRMFGVDPARVHELERINNALHRWSTIAVPRVIRKGVIDEREFVVVEKLEGEVCSTFKNQPDGAARQGDNRRTAHASNVEGGPSAGPPTLSCRCS